MWNSCVVTVAFLYCDTSLQSMAWDDDFDKIKIIWNESLMKKKIPGLVGNMIMIKCTNYDSQYLWKKKKCLHYDMTHGIAMNISVLW